MDNQTQPNIPPFQSQTQVPVLPSTNWVKVLLFILLGLIIVAGSIYAGIQIGKNQIIKQQSINEQSTISLTQTVVNQEIVPTIKLSTEPNPTTNLAADWKTYINKKVGITFDYPSNWTLEEPTIDVLQVSLYPPESDPNLPSSSINLSILNQFYLPQPTPYRCMTQYESFFTNSGLQGRRSEDEPISVGTYKCLPKVGGCFPTADIEFSLKNKTLRINYCLADKNRFEKIIKTLKIIQ